MGIRNLLRALDRGFTSLDDLLIRMTNSGDASYEEAATVLYRLLLTEEPSNIRFWVKYSIEGPRPASKSENDEGLACLRAAASSGKVTSIENADGRRIYFEHYGFEESDILSFLQKHEVAIPKGPINDEIRPKGVLSTSTDVGLHDALAISERERAEWKAKALAFSAIDDDRALLKQEIDRLREELRNTIDRAAQLVLERDNLKSEFLAGKTKTTALRIIGGMAIGGYGMDIHATRLTGLKELSTDLQQVGADVGEKTLRDWLKSASAVVEPKRAKT
jgi:hypothetical protein